MKGPRMLLFEGILLFEALKEISARNPKWQKTHHATRSLGIEEDGYRKSHGFFFRKYIYIYIWESDSNHQPKRRPQGRDSCTTAPESLFLMLVLE